MGGISRVLMDDMENLVFRRRRSRSRAVSAEEGSVPVPNTTEIYGFAIFCFTIISYGIFILWAFLPKSLLWYVGVTYYPSKYWAIAFPSLMIFTGLFTLLAYAGINLCITPSLDSFSTFMDKFSRKPRDRSQRTNLEDHGRVPAVSDLPLSVVNKLFFSFRPSKRKHHGKPYAISSWRNRYRLTTTPH